MKVFLLTDKTEPVTASKIKEVSYPKSGRHFWWIVGGKICKVIFTVLYRYKAYGQKNLPSSGSVLILCNHQSFFDPILAGMAAYKRSFYALARASLWNNKLAAYTITTFLGIPVDRGESDIKAMRKCITVLKNGHPLLLFPEGTRTDDGTTKNLTPGVMLIIKRAKPTIVPMAIDGAFLTWPKNKKLPKLFGRIKVNVGKPIASEHILAMGTDEALKFMKNTIEELRLELNN